jgi:hypothetical protein
MKGRKSSQIGSMVKDRMQPPALELPPIPTPYSGGNNNNSYQMSVINQPTGGY